MKDFLYYAQLVLESIASVVGMRPYEQPRYATVETVGERIEIRRYAERVAAEASLPAQDKAASDEAFRLLFGYIAGREKVEMTTPVATYRDGGLRMQFFLPSRYSAESAPAPVDPRVRIRAIPEETLATLRFSGRASAQEIERRRRELLAALEAGAWRALGEPVLLIYDPPFTLPFLRRNELAVAVAPW